MIAVITASSQRKAVSLAARLGPQGRGKPPATALVKRKKRNNTP